MFHIFVSGEGFVECPKAKPIQSEIFPDLTFFGYHTYTGAGEFSKAWTVSESLTGGSICSHPIPLETPSTVRLFPPLPTVTLTCFPPSWKSTTV